MAPLRAISLLQLERSWRGRCTKEVDGRFVTFILHKSQGGSQVFAVDAFCYHMGGELGEGDIEELDGRACIKCPVHQRKVDLQTGQDVTITDCPSQEPQQRIYKTMLDQAGWVWIESNDQPVASDKYNACSMAASRGVGLGDMPAPLTPYAGIDKRAMSPSPQELSQELLAQSQDRLRFPVRKSASMGLRSASMGLRNANARMAVLTKSRSPPMIDDMQA